MVLAIDAMLGIGVVFQFLTIPSQSRPGELFSPCSGGHCASPRARAPCSRKGCACPGGALMNLDGSAANIQLQQLETVLRI